MRKWAPIQQATCTKGPRPRRRGPKPRTCDSKEHAHNVQPPARQCQPTHQQQLQAAKRSCRQQEVPSWWPVGLQLLHLAIQAEWSAPKVYTQGAATGQLRRGDPLALSTPLDTTLLLRPLSRRRQYDSTLQLIGPTLWDFTAPWSHTCSSIGVGNGGSTPQQTASAQTVIRSLTAVKHSSCST